MASRFFSFPNPVNDVAARTVAAGVIVMSVVALVFELPWMTIPLAYGFVARVLAGPKISPLGRIATELVAPRLAARARFVPGPPKRFAQGIGALFTLTALALWLAGEAAACYVFLALLLVPATLEAAFGLCVGCQIFGLLMRRGLIPESVCLECMDLYGPGAAARRSARRSASEARSAS